MYRKIKFGLNLERDKIALFKKY